MRRDSESRRCGSADESAALSVSKAANGNLVISFQGTLEDTDSLVGGTWSTVSTTSPATVSPAGTAKFFRAKQ